MLAMSSTNTAAKGASDHDILVLAISSSGADAIGAADSVSSSIAGDKSLEVQVPSRREIRPKAFVRLLFLCAT